YLKLQSMRFNDRFDYYIEADSEIQIESKKVPTLLLQPFIENAIEHGIVHKKDRGLLKIIFKKENDLILCIIEDNGIGRQKSYEKRKSINRGHAHNSMGISISEERVRQLNDIV